MNELRRLQPQEIAYRLLGPAGALYREAIVYDGGRTGPRAMAVTLATRALPTDFQGLCEARTVSITFLLDSGTEDETDRKTRVANVVTGTRYRFAGDVERETRLVPAEDPEFARLCAAAGPVLAPASDIHGAPGFFSLSEGDASEAQFGARALRQALIDIRAGRLRDIDCHGIYGIKNAACSDPRGYLLSLSMRDVAGVSESRNCHDDESLACSRVDFDPSGDQPLSVEVRYRSSFENGRTRFDISGVRISYTDIIEFD